MQTTKISIAEYKKLTNDYTSSTEEIEEIIDSLYKLSLIAYKHVVENETKCGVL
jgi:hypothetical protein